MDGHTDRHACRNSDSDVMYKGIGIYKRIKIERCLFDPDNFVKTVTNWFADFFPQTKMIAYSHESIIIFQSHSDSIGQKAFLFLFFRVTKT